MINDLDSVVLTVDLPQYGLTAGDIGTVVMIHANGKGYEVEFMTLDGETLAVTSLLLDSHSKCTTLSLQEDLVGRCVTPTFLNGREYTT